MRYLYLECEKVAIVESIVRFVARPVTQEITECCGYILFAKIFVKNRFCRVLFCTDS